MTPAVVLLVVRMVLALCLYAFLAVALILLWRDLRAPGIGGHAIVAPGAHLTAMGEVPGVQALDPSDRNQLAGARGRQYHPGRRRDRFIPPCAHSLPIRAVDRGRPRFPKRYPRQWDRRRRANGDHVRGRLAVRRGDVRDAGRRGARSLSRRRESDGCMTRAGSETARITSRRAGSKQHGTQTHPGSDRRLGPVRA